MNLFRIKIFLILTLLAFIINSCSKSDFLKNFDYASESRFFEAKGNVKPIVSRIISKLKSENEKNSFVSSIIQKEGIPFWDKAIFKTLPFKSKKLLNRSQENDDTVVLIPLVLENTHYVNSFYAVKVSNIIVVKLISGKNYDTYPFSTDWDTILTADRIAAEMIDLEKKTFGHDVFKITDPRLFSKNGEIRDVNLETWGFSLASPTHCSSINIHFDGDFWTIDFCGGTWVGFDFGSDSGGGGGGGGSSGSSGTSSGNSGPNGGSGGSSSGNNNGLGWHYQEKPMPSPCAKAQKLKNSNNYKSHFSDLKNNTALNFESAYTFTNSDDAIGIWDIFSGAPNKNEVKISTFLSVQGVIHCHNPSTGGLKMFSVGDLVQINDLYYGNKINLYTFTSTLAISINNSYILTIGDKNKFLNFTEKWFGEIQDYLDLETLYKKYQIGNFSNQDDNVKAFLQLMKDQDMGLTLIEPNIDSTAYNVLSLDANNILVKTPCN